MTTHLSKIQSYVPQSIVDHLIQYQQEHGLTSISQSVATALAEFFNLNFKQSYLDSAGEGLTQRLEQLELMVLHLEKRLESVEQRPSLSTLMVGHRGDQSWIDSVAVAAVNHSDRYALAESGEVSNHAAAQPSVEVQRNCLHQLPFSSGHPSDRGTPGDSPSELLQDLQLETPAIDLSKGISSSMLARRLETNLATLRKYLRDQKQMQWAALRDPEGLGWTYDSLLHRYYPVPLNSDHNPDLSSSILRSPPHSSRCSQELFRQETEKSDIEDKSEIVVYPETGLSQAQLSKLTGIPTNTLQRWKQLPDCVQRIQKRTEGQFLYWYCERYELFYPLSIA